MSQTLTGGCMCDRIQYEIEGKPRFMYQCYCGKCRAASGASFVTNIIVDAARFRITAGKESLAAYESSPQKFRHFCSSCGSPIYSHGEKTKHVVSVRCGTLLQILSVTAFEKSPLQQILGETTMPIDQVNFANQLNLFTS